MSRLSTPLALAALLSLAACNGSGDASKTAAAAFTSLQFA